MAGRYLMYFSYIGTRYSGVQRQSPSAMIENNTIQGALEAGLRRLKSLNDIKTCLASRTDKGVHALMNTLHVDLLHRNSLQMFQPELIAAVVNNYLYSYGHDIVINKVERVPDWFHCRILAEHRTYMYRCAFLKPHLQGQNILKFRYEQFLPITEVNRCYIVAFPLDMDQVHRAMELMTGEHDYVNFMNTLSKRDREKGDKDTVKDIQKFTLQQSQPLHPIPDPLYENVDFWEFHLKSKSFLYRQVRRMIGAVLSVGSGRSTLDSIKKMLENPSKENWDGRIRIVPAEGLYLTQIDYDRKYFDLDAEPPDRLAAKDINYDFEEGSDSEDDASKVETSAECSKTSDESSSETDINECKSRSSG